MKTSDTIKWIALLVGLSSLAPAQRQRFAFPEESQEEQEEVPLMRPDELEAVNGQSDDFNNALEPTLSEAAESTVVVWGTRGRKPSKLAYGTVVGDGSQVLTKWSEIEPSADILYVQTGGGVERKATVTGVFAEEDLALLQVDGDALKPVKFEAGDLSLGRFITATQPNGKPAGFGVVAVLERNLRETDQAHLGVEVDPNFRGKGVRIANVQPEYGAEEAGLQSGDVILAVEGRAISGLQELKNALTNKQPGDTVELLIDSAGKEMTVSVLLSNRPVTGQFSGDRLNQMEAMGGELNSVRDGFSRVIQTDMKIAFNQMGGPVVDLQGRVVGITMARADRTRTYIMGSGALLKILAGEPGSVADAKAKAELKKEQLAEQRRAMIPQMRGRAKPQDRQRMQRNLSDLERLLGKVSDELEDLD
ncbi:MAG: PDZ domain-containing protein [Akkermansiaceae bacterium]|nr:PDZ domain-containing protein [Akkermansiaceae bacterium]MDP4646387.1 PDZ domain-containing protein [Akkermansiaceae bacterium]MDP4721922.1 PDZ domain-containing protein [Akkermansiaceae bacterium]MDP4779990.1 PDZ domain-containing protein [Akkermansiaceae bacterium]MDP4847084.1 PDZ domain-containing protein [Akkermansiaceae bacterium]